jgi:D-beta-D-heptose 7-phosphate kinase/D-beta-D-heptose 1-phosphate adenosyltransferase
MEAKEMRIFTNGVFDGLHFGHFYFLKLAREMGDSLTVGVNSDSSVKRIRGAGKPIHPLGQRILMLEALRFVDEVIAFDELTPEVLIRKIKPDLIVKGSDWEHVHRPWEDVCKTIFIDRLPGFLSSR